MYQKIQRIGLLRATMVLRHRLDQKMTKISPQSATWDLLAQTYQIDENFEVFLQKLILRSLSYIHDFYNNQLDQTILITHADAWVNHYFAILGSQPQHYSKIPWHTDIRLQQQNPDADCEFDSASFYKDIRIQVGQSDQLIKDIKVPWQLSRFQHLFVLGKAYEITQDEKYAQSFTHYITDWLDHNPYLHGIHWLNPMEVGLRALNWIIAWEFFKRSPSISPEFSQRFVCSLYDHMTYLEHNWELYDGRTNNHYLSNLVGYAYLCWFFADKQKQKKCVKHFFVEYDWQIFDEGTNYEGSTQYHAFVTELVYHMFLLCKEMNHPFSKAQEEKLQRMFAFIAWCTPEKGTLISIGDQDSGTVLYYGLPIPPGEIKELRATEEYGTKYFLSFGLSIIKTPQLHISLRHHAYQSRQPSGHFHADACSITIAVNGIPVIIDPGSYVYTASKYWRNYFRSIQVHNTFFVKDAEPLALYDLFGLAMPIKKDFNKANFIAEHTLLEQYGIHATRSLQLYDNEKIVTIRDEYQQTKGHMLTWNFTLAPGITALQQNNQWIFLYKHNYLLTLQTDLQFKLVPTYVSLSYGVIQPSYCLKADQGTTNCVSLFFIH